MDLELQGKRALVTGSNSGIGAAIARTLAAEGASVVIHGRDEARCRAVADEIAAQGGVAHVAVGDLATESGCARVGDAVSALLGGVDVLVNNAGGRANHQRRPGDAGTPNLPWLETPWSDWSATFEQNVGATVRMIQRLVPGMKERGWGRVIQIASASASQAEPDLADYQAAKAALIHISASLARTLARTGITVNTVSPGTIQTAGVVETFTRWARELGWNADDWDEVERRFATDLIPISTEHFGRPEDVGRLVALLASPLSGYTTGANYRIDGGQCRSVN